MAKRQAARKAQKVTEMDKAFDKRQARKELQQVKTLGNKTIVEARKRRREDWLLGPLAPRRDIGDMREKYATVDSRRTQLPDVHPDHRLKLSPFAEGDRVVLLTGRDKGKIGEVRHVDEDSQTVQVKDLNLVCSRSSYSHCTSTNDFVYRQMSSFPSICGKTRATRSPPGLSSSRFHFQTSV